MNSSIANQSHAVRRAPLSVVAGLVLLLPAALAAPSQAQPSSEVRCAVSADAAERRAADGGGACQV